MLRDVPRIYLMILAFVVVIFLLVFWYRENFYRDSDVLHLNELILTSTITEVDQTSRIHEGVLMLSDTFETKVWESLESAYDEGSKVMFDYKFDISDTRFTNVTDEQISTGPYYIGSGDVNDIPQAGNLGNAEYYTKRPVQAVRVKVKDVNDAFGEWTYIGSVRVDIASRN